MILNPDAKKVLCFGDSLTWGHFHGGIRFDVKDRWAYKLQELLGSNFDVIEEGLRSRTTNIEDADSLDRNGFPYFRACFESHDPVDVLVYMLGTNDTKVKFNRSADQICDGIAQSISWVKSFINQRKTDTKIIVVAPPQIEVSYLKQKSSFDKTSNDKLVDLGPKLKALSEQEGLIFVDLSQIMKGAKEDGVHLTVADNQKIAEILSSVITKI